MQWSGRRSLQNRKLIRYQRGNITTVNRNGLMATSCGCYATDQASYTRDLG